VSCSEVLHAVRDNPQATLVGDLATGQGIPVEAFDCMILTQTFPFIYDVQGAITNTYTALKLGGVLLATLPGISQISRYDMDRWGISGIHPTRGLVCKRVVVRSLLLVHSRRVQEGPSRKALSMHTGITF
jgi:hypothetical protein